MFNRISLALITVAPAAVTLPVSAHAQRCNIGGEWRIHQTNGEVAANMIQTGAELVGTGIYRSQSGTIKGKIHGRDVLFTIRWPGGSVGEYDGKILSGGRLKGQTRDLSHPESQSSWWGSRKFRC